MNEPPCIIGANPDIAGVGVRASIYAQALLALVPPILSVIEFPFWHKSRAPVDAIKRVNSSTFTVILTGTALLIAAFFQASTLGLSVYHATIVLYLSWLNNITACAVLSFRWMLDSHRLRGTTNWQRIKSKEFAAYNLHLSATGALGIWLFSDVHGFDILKQCTDSTVMYVFGHYPRVAAPGTRIAWLVVYSFAVVPLLNWTITTLVLMMSFFVIYTAASMLAILVPLVLVCFCACCVCMPGFDRVTEWIDRVTSDDIFPADEEQDIPDEGLWRVVLRVFPIGWILFILILDIGVFVSTEQTIRHNHVGPGEGQWTFGQTLALLVVVFPMLDVWEMIKDVSHNRRRQPLEESGPADDRDDAEAHELAEIPPADQVQPVDKPPV